MTINIINFTDRDTILLVTDTQVSNKDKNALYYTEKVIQLSKVFITFNGLAEPIDYFEFLQKKLKNDSFNVTEFIKEYGKHIEKVIEVIIGKNDIDDVLRIFFVGFGEIGIPECYVISNESDFKITKKNMDIGDTLVIPGTGEDLQLSKKIKEMDLFDLAVQSQELFPAIVIGGELVLYVVGKEGLDQKTIIHRFNNFSSNIPNKVVWIKGKILGVKRANYL